MEDCQSGYWSGLLNRGREFGPWVRIPYSPQSYSLFSDIYLKISVMKHFIKQKLLPFNYIKTYTVTNINDYFIGLP